MYVWVERFHFFALDDEYRTAISEPVLHPNFAQKYVKHVMLSSFFVISIHLTTFHLSLIIIRVFLDFLNDSLPEWNPNLLISLGFDFFSASPTDQFN